MADKASEKTVKKNAKIWAKNLPSKGKKDRKLPRIENFDNYIRLPKKIDVLGCYHTLLEKEKWKQKRVKIIHEELLKLWKKMSFPVRSDQTIVARINKLIADYEKNQRRPKEKFKNNLESVFDITKPEGNWLCKEDRTFYEIQIESEGKIGYTTHKKASSSSIHPSKTLATESGSKYVRQAEEYSSTSSAPTSSSSNCDSGGSMQEFSPKPTL